MLAREAGEETGWRWLMTQRRARVSQLGGRWTSWENAGEGGLEVLGTKDLVTF